VNGKQWLRNAALCFSFIGLIGSTSVSAGATEHETVGANALSDSGLLYNSKALNHAIESYPSIAGVRESAKTPQIVYVDQAYGQAIYSYPRVAQDVVTAFNVQYVNPAYGQAIYSYPGLWALRGKLSLFSFVD
jgi:hypothetical protein